MKRREFITLPAKALGGLLIYTLAGEPIRLGADEGTIRLPFVFSKSRKHGLSKRRAIAFFQATKVALGQRKPAW
jgi:hypothetical protein